MWAESRTTRIAAASGISSTDEETLQDPIGKRFVMIAARVALLPGPAC